MKLHPTAIRATALLLLFCLLVPLTACSPYRLELSTAEQSAIVLHTDEYDIAFEVVDFFYHNYRPIIDGGDESVWDGEEAARYHGRLLARAIEASCELYAVFSCAKDFGIDPWGSKIEEQMEEGIRAVIDSYPTRRDYIDHLESLHMTDSVYRLIMRSYLCQQYLLEYSEGVSSVSEEDLRAFCESEDVINTLCLTVYFTEGNETALRWARERANIIKEALRGVTTDDGFREVTEQYATTPNASEMEHGIYMTLREYRRLCEDENASPKPGDMSGPLFDADCFLFVRCIEKDYDTVKNNPSAVRSCYLEYLIEQKIDKLLASFSHEEAAAALTRERFA